MKKSFVSVEFFGMPGVGKSVLSSKIAETLSERNITVEQNAYFLSHQMNRMQRTFFKMLYVLKELFLHPFYAFISIRTIIKTQQRSAVDLIKVVFNWFFVSSLIRSNKNHKGVRLFDEGIFQALWSIGFSGNNESLVIMKPLFSLMPLPDMIIVPEADLAAIKLRMSGRERHDSRLEKGSVELLEMADALFSETKQILKSLAEQNKNLQLSCVKNEKKEDLEGNTEMLAAKIEHLLNADKL
jgi:broad-specificity NMP kinase